MKLKDSQPLSEDDRDNELITLKLHPKILTWVKKEDEKRGISDQMLITAILLQHI